jgi:hypothetical protein
MVNIAPSGLLTPDVKQNDLKSSFVQNGLGSRAASPSLMQCNGYTQTGSGSGGDVYSSMAAYLRAARYAPIGIANDIDAAFRFQCHLDRRLTTCQCGDGQLPFYLPTSCCAHTLFLSYSYFLYSFILQNVAATHTHTHLLVFFFPLSFSTRGQALRSA